jgi:hypothetical protein
MEAKYQQFFFDLRGKLLSGLLSYDEAKNLARPILDEMNIKGAMIAKKHGKHFTKFSYEKIIR